jgi:hypothetical protein
MDWTTGVRSPTGAEDFSSTLCVQTGSGAHPASCTMGTGVLSPGVKRGRGVMLITHPHLVPRLSMSRSYASSPPCASMACSGTALLLRERKRKMEKISLHIKRETSSSFLLFAKYYYSDKIKENGIGRTYSMLRGD